MGYIQPAACVVLVTLAVLGARVTAVILPDPIRTRCTGYITRSQPSGTALEVSGFVEVIRELDEYGRASTQLRVEEVRGLPVGQYRAYLATGKCPNSAQPYKAGRRKGHTGTPVVAQVDVEFDNILDHVRKFTRQVAKYLDLDTITVGEGRATVNTIVPKDIKGFAIEENDEIVGCARLICDVEWPVPMAHGRSKERKASRSARIAIKQQQLLKKNPANVAKKAGTAPSQDDNKPKKVETTTKPKKVQTTTKPKDKASNQQQ
eukprot:m.137125 g.137125  ORF g.137125 m.137125 type:complete len:262 (+) comp16987_c1_seq1:219-1004(+)